MIEGAAIALPLEREVNAPSAADVVASVDDESVEPGRELLVRAERTQVAVKPQEHLLGRVQGVGLAAENAPGRRDHPTLVPGQELDEGGRVALLRALDHRPQGRDARLGRGVGPLELRSVSELAHQRSLLLEGPEC